MLFSGSPLALPSSSVSAHLEVPRAVRVEAPVESVEGHDRPVSPESPMELDEGTPIAFPQPQPRVAALQGLLQAEATEISSEAAANAPRFFRVIHLHPSRLHTLKVAP